MVWLGVVGAAFGSFAGAVAWRLHERRNFVTERSECEHCHHTLAWYDLLPVVSWLLLAGRCRYCHKKIGQKTLVVELFTATAFVTSYVFWPFQFDNVLASVMFLLWLSVIVVSAILFVYDLRWKLLPTVVLWLFVAVSAVFFVLRQAYLRPPLSQMLPGLMLAMLPIAGVYGTLYILSRKRWVGAGDIKIGLAMGFLLTWQQALVALVLANFLGTLTVLGPLIRGKITRAAKIPFGPFLIIAAIGAFLWSDAVIDWYLLVLGLPNP
jgi:prepilin signal peptidase PulO-like enzyme (type II secretory pathway)